jgi:hypothetical protein
MILTRLQIVPGATSSANNDVSALKTAATAAPLANASRQAISRHRLSGPQPAIDERIRPLRKHWGDPGWDRDWSLYWLPMEFRNKRDTQADPRFMKFFEGMIALFQQGPKLSQFTFFDSQLLHPYLIKHFVLHATDYFPLGAIGFRPEAGPCKVPDYDDASAIDPHKTFKMLKEKQQSFGLGDLFPTAPSMVYYLVAGQEQARHNLTGRGGYGFVLSKLDQKTFFDMTKEMLARNSDDEALLRMPLVAPTLTSASFTRGLRPDVEQWFSMLDLYVQESPIDKGVLIASNRCLDEEIAELVVTSRLNESGLRKRFGLSMLRTRGEER